jgi:hypothetical protein
LPAIAETASDNFASAAADSESSGVPGDLGVRSLCGTKVTDVRRAKRFFNFD